MSHDPDRIRHSVAEAANLIPDEEERARKEAENGLRQFDAVKEQVAHWLETRRPFRLRVSAILGLHRVALDGISQYAGNFRPADIAIGKSTHKPPGAHMVPELVEEMCDYVNENWDSKTAIHLSSYVMWRLNWIHAFTDGNGRTSRAVSWLVLCMRLGYQLPGVRTIPDQITENRDPYYRALEDADDAAKEGRIDLSSLESLMGDMLAVQLVAVHKDANGTAQ